MSRFSLLLLIAGLAVGTLGCAFGDTVDDFPVPCIGGNCGPAAYNLGAPSGVMMGPEFAVPTGPAVSAPAVAPSVPVTSSEPGPFHSPLPEPLGSGSGSQASQGETPPAAPATPNH